MDLCLGVETQFKYQQEAVWVFAEKRRPKFKSTPKNVPSLRAGALAMLSDGRPTSAQPDAFKSNGSRDLM
jgi:hypothetical protein